MASKFTLFCDGASRGNPGPGAYGFVVLSEGKLVAEEGARLGNVTNNYAEYQGLLHGLRKCKSLGAEEVEVRADSELMIRQLKGMYKVRSPLLLPLFQEASGLLKNFKRVALTHIPREENTDADRLCNLALDGN